MAYNKYRVAPKEKRMYKGVLYASLKERDYAAKLDLLKSAKFEHERVLSWERQISYPLVISGVDFGVYRLDFKVRYADGRVIYVDVKGYKKGVAYQLFTLKKKLMRVCYNIFITEV